MKTLVFLPEPKYPMASFTVHPSTSGQLGHPSAWFRCFILETECNIFSFFCIKYTCGMMQRIYAFRKLMKFHQLCYMPTDTYFKGM